MSGAVTEKELQARSTGKRVTEQEVLDNIVGVDYAMAGGGTLMFCILTLRNGYQVHGVSACADPANFKQDVGERISKADAVNKIWPLMGYALKDRMAADERLANEREIYSSPDMKLYIGTKVIHAKPMSRGEYLKLRGWELPFNENAWDEGYFVEYTDERQETEMVSGYLGYVSWSPKKVFERAYREIGPYAPQARDGSQTSGTASVEPEPFLVRLRKERSELVDKLNKLNSFIEQNGLFATLPRQEQSDLKEQASFMLGYLTILDRRLKRFD